MSCLFIATMDDVIYGDLKRNVILPMQMVSVKGKASGYELKDAQAVAQGTGKFLKAFKPHAIVPSNEAKDLLLRDAEYSTPQDHYFAHIQSKKAID